MSETVDEAIAALEDYLRRYPSGNFSELAQTRLDRLLTVRGERKITPASSEANPLSKGFAAARTDWRVGDRYEARVVDLYGGRETRRVEVVTAVNEFEVIFNDGRVIRDLLGNQIRRADGVRFANQQHFPAEYAIGKKWTSRYEFGSQVPFGGHTEIAWVVAGREDIVVPAGRFNAFRVEGTGWQNDRNKRDFTYWIAPDKVRVPLVMEQWRKDSSIMFFGGLIPGRSERSELIAFHEAFA